MLELPITLQLATLSDVAQNPAVLARLEKAKTANIVPGYVSRDKVEKGELPFNFYAEINVDNAKLWDLIIALSKALPEVAALIFHHIEAAPIYGKYLDKHELLMDIESYKKELIADTFFEWGLMYQDSDRLVEILISQTKYIKFWGVDKEEFQLIMAQMNLPEVVDLEFIDEYPRARQPLRLFAENVLDTPQLVEALLSKYVE